MNEQSQRDVDLIGITGVIFVAFTGLTWLGWLMVAYWVAVEVWKD